MKSLKKAVRTLTGIALSYLFFVVPAMANETVASASDDKSWVKVVMAGVTIAAASIGGTIGQAKAAAVALEAIGRNPSAQNKIFVPLIVSLALLESLVIYALVVVFAKM